MSIEGIAARVHALISEQLGSDPFWYMQNVIQDSLDDSASGQESPVTLAVRRLRMIIGSGAGLSTTNEVSLTSLRDNAMPAAHKAGCQLGGELREWILALVDLEKARVDGARQAVGYVREQLNRLQNQAAGLLQESKAELAKALQSVSELQDNPFSKRRSARKPFVASLEVYAQCLLQPQLYLEQFIFISGHYEIDFDRNVSYVIKVDPDVVGVSIGTKKFPILNESGVWKKFGKKVKHGVGITKQDLELNVVENAVKSMTDSMYLDHNGLDTAFSYSTNSDAVENYVQRTLDVNREHIRRIKMTDDEIFSKLFHKLKESLKHDLKINHEEYVVTEFREIFVPIYETKCYDQKSKVAIARVDAVTGKII